MENLRWYAKYFYRRLSSRLVLAWLLPAVSVWGRQCPPLHRANHRASVVKSAFATIANAMKRVARAMSAVRARARPIAAKPVAASKLDLK